MTPWLRSTFRLVRLLLVLAAVLVPCGTAGAYAPEATPPDTPGPSASVEPSRGGNRPGRQDDPAAHTEGVDDREDRDQGDDAEGEGDDGGTSPDSGRRWHHHGGHDGHDDRDGDDDAYGGATPTASESTQQAGLAPSADAAHGRANASEPALRLLPLGSGLVLIGLGLALAFVGLRLRRG
ncbi:hypothetical protein [Streptomyces sp. NPDC102462]|uniref:hypothetical protein n=1 Tax=Streptomyces sp. NPDC102462 TaxID=3366178 RepID=UPI0038161EE2